MLMPRLFAKILSCSHFCTPARKAYQGILHPTKKTEHKLRANLTVIYTLFTLGKILSSKLVPHIRPAYSSLLYSFHCKFLASQNKLFLYSKYLHPLSSKFVKQELLQVHKWEKSLDFNRFFNSKSRSHWILNKCFSLTTSRHSSLDSSSCT